MRVLHISKYDLKGGASRAAYNSVVAQRRVGLPAEMLVGIKESHSAFVHAPWPKAWARLNFAADKIPALFAASRAEVRSLHSFGMSAASIERYFRPDVVVAHKIDGILRVSELARFKAPVIWRLHDMWPICGTRHYQSEEEVLNRHPWTWSASPASKLIDVIVYRRKAKIFSRCPTLTFCTPSRWLADCVKKSPLMMDGCRVVVVPNGIDTAVFRPIDREAAREKLNLPADRSIVLFGAGGALYDPRKGLDLLLEAFIILRRKSRQHPLLVVFGEGIPDWIEKTGLSATTIGAIKDDDRLTLAYSAADLFVAPSRQENLSLTVLESLACGTPVIAFEIGGMPDMIRHGVNGFLAEPSDASDLADKLELALRLSNERMASLRTQARQTVLDNFSMDAEAKQMLDVIHSVHQPGLETGY